MTRGTRDVEKNTVKRMKTKILQILAVVCFVTLALGTSLRASIVTPIYAVARLSYAEGPPFSGYQFGVFDLGSPTGSPGSYQYAWTSLGSASSEPLANLALNPVTSQMYVQYFFNEYRTVSTSGVVGGSSLGAMDTLFGMSFDNSGNLYGAYSTDWYTLDSSTGSTTSTAPVVNSLYSQFGGGLAYASDGNFYFASSYPSSLYRITAGGTDTPVGDFAGTNYDENGWNTLFSSGVNSYLLNENRLYQVNLSDASLSLMGTITGLPTEFSSGFSGAVGLASSPAAVPEPGTWAAAALLAGGAGFMRWRKRAKVS
ncbi:MAG: PEP-CTERM sorting domain-containing protein [Chthoniobacterales bacterium]|nr:PEP-CTERM sorting domain-containing protein [Chthoniobacterales bacterium]